jgi:hypothetical protein
MENYHCMMVGQAGHAPSLAVAQYHSLLQIKNDMKISFVVASLNPRGQ